MPTKIRFPSAGTLFTALFLLLFLFLQSCGSETSSGGPQGPRTIEATGFRAEAEPYTITIRATGELLPFEEVELRTPLAGNVLSIHFSEGQYVRQNDLIVKIDSRTWKAQRRGLQAQLVSAENELKRKEQLLEIEGTSREELEQAETRVSSLKAQIEELSVRIDLAQVRAPFSGQVGMRDFSIGAYLSQGDRITHLADNRRLRVSFTIPARYAPLAKVGLMVNVVSSASDTIQAEVYAVDPVIDRDNRSLNVRAAFDNQNFVPGDFAQVIFEVEQNENALLVPAEAVIAELNAQIVYVAREGKAHRQTVEIGTRTPGRVHIINGLAEGDTVLITGLMEMRDGSNINVSQLNQEAGQ